jgi:hypothetical protein
MQSPDFVELLLLVLQTLIALLLAIGGYFGRRLYRQVDRNTRFRRHAVGDNEFDAEGRLDDFETLHRQLRKDHQEVSRRLEDVRQTLGDVIRELNESGSFDVDVGAERPDDDDRWDE